MDKTIQFRVDEEIKTLAQKAIEKRGLTISQICRDLVFFVANMEEPSIDLQKSSTEIDYKWLMSTIENGRQSFEEKDKKALSIDEAFSLIDIKRKQIEKTDHL